MKCSTSSAVTMVAVGLFGLAMNTILVMGVIARAIAVEVEPVVLQRDHHADAAGRLHDHRVHDEGGVRDHRLVPRAQEGADQQLDQLVGAVAQDDVVGR